MNNARLRLSLRLRSMIGYASNETHTVTMDQWQQIQNVLYLKVNLQEQNKALVEALNNLLVGMEASGGWEGDDGLFDAGIAALRAAGIK